MTALNGPTSNSAPSTVASATKSDDQYSQPPASPSPRLDLDAASPSAVSGAVNPTASPTAATAAPKAAVEAKTAPVTSETSVKVGLDIQNPVGASSHESPLQSHKSAPITVSPAIVEPENQSRKEQISTHIELQKQEEEQAQTQTQTQTQTEPESQNQQMEQKQKQGLGHESSEAPLFQSSIPSASVRDFAYPPDHSLYYGALPTLADKKRNSESATGDPRADEDDDEMSPSSWDPEAMYSHMSAVKLPAMSFADGPPFNDGEDYDDYGSSGMYYFSKAQQGRGLEGDEFAGDMALDGVPADEYITGSPYGKILCSLLRFSSRGQRTVVKMDY